MSEIQNMQQIAQQRARLLQQSAKEQRQLMRDIDTVQKSFSRFFSLGKTVSSITQVVAPKLDWFLFGFSIFKSLFRKRKKR